jgi:glucose-6-phosphate 1-dehydrogenase
LGRRGTSNLLLALLLDEPVRNERRWWVHDTLKTREQLGEYHSLVKELEADEARVQAYFRMSPAVFDEEFQMLNEEIEMKTTRFRKPIGARESLAMCIRSTPYVVGRFSQVITCRTNTTH